MSIFDDIAKALEEAARTVLDGVTEVVEYVIQGVQVVFDTVEGGISSGARACAEFVEGVAFVVVREATSAADVLKQTTEQAWTSVRAVVEGGKPAPAPIAMGARVRDPRGDVYLMIDGRLRHVPDRATYDRIFREWGGFTDVPNASAYPVGEPLGGDASLLRDPATGKVYLLVDGTRRWIVGPHVFDRYGFGWSHVEDLSADALARHPEGAPVSGEYIPDGRRVVEPASGAIYVMLGGALRHIPDPATYNNLFRDWKGIGALGNLGGQRVEPALSNGAHLANGTPDGRVFLVSNGVKRWVSSPAVMDRYQFKWTAVRNLPAAQLTAMPDGPAIE
jgi:hypothetical protein